MKKLFLGIGIFPETLMFATLIRVILISATLICVISNAADAAAQSSPPATPGSGAATGQPPSSQPGSVTHIASGSVIPVYLSKTVDAKKAKVGDEVEAKVTQDLKKDGTVIVAKDTKVMGHVTESQARTKDQKESKMAIAFDRAVMKDGSAMQIPMSIQAIIGSENNVSGNNSAGDSTSSMPSGGGAAMPGHGAGGASPTSQAGSGANASDSSAPGSNGRPTITGNTQGVVGINNLKLAPASATDQGSILTSEKNNVKLESGTMMLLRVN
jgi:hypothetical protein